MTPPNGKTVALIDPLWIGHHPMYFCQFTASFLRTGANVIGLCPEPAAALRDLQRALGEPSASQIQNRVFFHELPTGKRSFFNGRFEGDPFHTFLRWKNAADHLADAEALSGMTADLVFFPYLDSYLRFLPFATIPRFLLNRRWSGLYMRNHHHGERSSPFNSLRLLAKGDRVLKSKLCEGIGVLDERFIPAMEKRYKTKVVAFPDVTQANLPDQPSAISVRIKHQAAGRKIIGLIGLERRKGFFTCLRVAELARERGLPYYFVASGMMNLREFTMPEQEKIRFTIRQIAACEIDNFHFDPTSSRIPDEADYNSLFTTFDIAWAAYEGFHGSSGTLSKAAAFHIPCIATAGECVGQRVEKFNLGLTVPEADPEQALAAIPHLLAGTDRDGCPLSHRFEEYRLHHSQKLLDQILSDLLESDLP